MTLLGRALLAAGMMTISFAAKADKLPPLKLSAHNKVPICATPGRIMAFLKARNPSLRSRFEKIAVNYMQHGQALGVRWDFALFQMVVETNFLKFTGDVDWRQNNFAGLGATGGGVKGERFDTVSDGVKAHLQHLMVYAGMHVDDPVADRTRKVQAWGVLDKWRRRLHGAVTFGQIGRQWAPGDRGYGRDIQAIADLFYDRWCQRPDPAPELLAEAHGVTGLKPTTIATTTRRELPRDSRSALGVGPVAPRAQVSGSGPQVSASPAMSGGVTILNQGAASAKPKDKAMGEQSVRRPEAQVASAAGAAAKFAVPSMRPRRQHAPQPPLPEKRADRPAGAADQVARVQKAVVTKSAPPAPKPDPSACRVWTASYGGQKTIIIRSATPESVNYTVLDVNEGREKREAAAYIAAYAKGGEPIGTFKTQTQALEKAFKLCPNG